MGEDAATASEEKEEAVEELKARGNELFRARRYAEAGELYSAALALARDPWYRARLLSNLSGGWPTGC